MKIGIPVDKNSMETDICISFGRAPWFMLVDTVTEESQFVDNSAAASQGGAGIKAAQILVDKKIEALLTPRCGENAAEVFKAAAIQMYRTNGANLKENLEAFKAGELPLLVEVHAGFHGHGEK